MLNLLKETRTHNDAFPQKLTKMQEIYLQNNPMLYTPQEITHIQHYLKAAMYKFYLAGLSLEQLWAVTDSKRLTVLDAIDNGLNRLDYTADELLVTSLAFETFLFQGRSFLDFYMIYLCHVLKTGHRGSMSFDQFFKELNKVSEEPFNTKVQFIRDYFTTVVFGIYDQSRFASNGWGQLLRDLRNKIAHKDVVNPSHQGSETLFGSVIFDWPTIQGMTYDRFCQDMENGMFYMLTEIASVIYEVKWKAGPYNPEMWSENP